MEQENLKYAKRKWHKGNFYLKYTTEKKYLKEGVVSNYLEVEMYVGNRNIVMNCYNPNVILTLNKAYPKEKIKVWFSTESKKYNDKWYTNNTIKHIEIPRVENLEKMKEEYVNNNTLNFDTHSEDF